jgi:hypothetical protein
MFNYHVGGLRTMADTEAAPPLDYPFPERQDDGDYFVPADLWSWYCHADPSPAAKAAYVSSGCTITERVERDLPRLIVRGGDRPDQVTSQPITVSEFRQLSGVRDYRYWLHRERIDIAWRARKAAPRLAANQARTEAARCAVCGVHGSHLPVAPGQPYAAQLWNVHACSDHAALLAVRLVERFAAADGRRRLADGRTVDDAVDDVLDDLVDVGRKVVAS